MTEYQPADLYRGDPFAWQQRDETIQEFLKRVPIGTRKVTDLDKWLFVGSPTVPAVYLERFNADEDPTFQTLGEKLLDDDRLARQNITDKDNRKVLTELLEADILELAKRTKVTGGKWLIYVNADKIRKAWKDVAIATSQGKLGPVSKVATAPQAGRGRVICVFTYDFSDKEDLRRVVQELASLGLCSPGGQKIHYKCNAFTSLGIYADNEHKLKPTLFSSDELL